jgi:hypothetical protein
MPDHDHAIVWIDHREARIFHVTASEADQDLEKRISGVEALDHPSGGEPIALARKFFRADDRKRSQTR